MGMVTAIALFWSNKPNPAMGAYKKRYYHPWQTSLYKISVAWVRFSTPQVFYSYFFNNHGNRLRLETIISRAS
jgi:hypothetical protein